MICTIIADYTTALTAARAITTGLLAKQRSGIRATRPDRDARCDDFPSGSEAMPTLTFVGGLAPQDGSPLIDGERRSGEGRAPGEPPWVGNRRRPALR